jgi:Rps23 Pro-64 3,4-dihydroxylase Tpa1-like proline 4-hydroxylase
VGSDSRKRGWRRLLGGLGSPPATRIASHARWKELASRESASYGSADPFPHAVIDRFLDEDVLDEIRSEVPDWTDRSRWLCFDTDLPDGRVAQRGKLHISDEQQLGPTTRALLQELRSAAFLETLEVLTGIGGLIPDPHNVGGGLHLCLPGSVLRVHADFSRHPTFGLDRRLNLVLYLNRDWEERFGGSLELWRRDMSECGRRIEPVANRVVVFDTTRDALHGHPDPVRCPEGRARMSLALYYYTNGRPPEEDTPEHSTLWQNAPGELESR